MKIRKELDLYKYSTMRTHSIGRVMYTPESIEELRKLLTTLDGNYYILGAGSNVVFAPRVERPIINMMELFGDICITEEGYVKAGCSVRIQKLINFGKEHALGGFEYLYSLPASVGGIIYMNAGRGKKRKQQISDWLVSVDYLDIEDMQVKSMVVTDSGWTYRCSPFQKMKAVILTATFKMHKTTSEDVSLRIQERINTVKKSQEGDKPSCGSVFIQSNKYIMRLLRGKKIGGAHFSRKTSNWISNDQNGTASDVISLINLAEFIHKLTFQKYNLEIQILK